MWPRCSPPSGNQLLTVAGTCSVFTGYDLRPVRNSSASSEQERRILVSVRSRHDLEQWARSRHEVVGQGGSMRHLRLLAHSTEGAALCFRSFCQQGVAEPGPHDHPDVTLDCIALARSMPAWDH